MLALLLHLSVPQFAPCKEWVNILQGAVDCLSPRILLVAGKAQLPPWKANLWLASC